MLGSFNMVGNMGQVCDWHFRGALKPSWALGRWPGMGWLSWDYLEPLGLASVCVPGEHLVHRGRKEQVKQQNVRTGFELAPQYKLPRQHEDLLFAVPK